MARGREGGPSARSPIQDAACALLPGGGAMPGAGGVGLSQQQKRQSARGKSKVYYVGGREKVREGAVGSVYVCVCVFESTSVCVCEERKTFRMLSL